MKTTNLTKIKKHGTKVIAKDEPTLFLVNSDVHSVIVPADQYEAMVEAIEDYEDMLAIESRKDEETVDWETVKKWLDEGNEVED